MKLISLILILSFLVSCLPDPSKTVKKKAVIEQMVMQIEKVFFRPYRHTARPQRAQ